ARLRARVGEPRSGEPRARPLVSPRPSRPRRRDRGRRAVPRLRRFLLHDRGRLAHRRWLSCLQGHDGDRPTEVTVMRLLIAAIVALPALATTPAAAQSVADFYRGKTVTIVVSTSTGGGYDAMARAGARHIGRHIPRNPPVAL